MSDIGGYFSLELNKHEELHDKAIKLNTGRNALEYILRANKYSTVYIPYYTCDALLQPFIKCNIVYQFYSIDEKFEPIFDFTCLTESDAFLYINYFGLKDRYISRFVNVDKNIIIDNSQSFFSLPIEGLHTFYSARKFFGVPDGAYLYTPTCFEEPIGIDLSFERFNHLLRRIDNSAENGYPYFVMNESKMDALPLLHMSNLTRGILQSIDYTHTSYKRRQNFNFLHAALSKANLLNIHLGENAVPLIYPFLSHDLSLKKRLLLRKMYVPVFWQSVLSRVPQYSLEHRYVENIVHLPIDQRYGPEDLQKLLEVISL